MSDDAFLATAKPPTAAATRVAPARPDLLLSENHHLCPGCGEPLAIRALLEAIEELGCAESAIGVMGIGCYTAFSSALDVDLVQALHGRSPSVAMHYGSVSKLTSELKCTPAGDAVFGDLGNTGGGGTQPPDEDECGFDDV